MESKKNTNPFVKTINKAGHGSPNTEIITQTSDYSQNIVLSNIASVMLKANGKIMSINAPGMTDGQFDKIENAYTMWCFDLPITEVIEGPALSKTKLRSILHENLQT